MSMYMDTSLDEIVKATRPLRRARSTASTTKPVAAAGGAVRNGRRGAPRAAAKPYSTKPVVKVPPPVKSTATKILLENLHPRVNDADIKELFGNIGPVKKAMVHYNAQGKSVGTAEIEYTRPEHVTRAIKEYSNISLDGRPMKLSLVEPPKSDVLSRLTNQKPRPAQSQPRANNNRPTRGGRGGLRGGRVPRASRVPRTEADLDNELTTYQE
eukprot:Ihof_evm2s765 gene=Ihof_evmTU2s765